ncbi:hypothetical protein NLU13_1896 [Sarocladium strictum]|uniref:hydroxyacylglutathione hydrolase n=1 Tax=Sarocladium strictum TaxID=5046 RepID=A0AA39LC73_SARSR|nr:hypothetical protein NLU13_1896 [Sarocladium strictum]
MHIQPIPMWEGSSNNYAYLVVDDKTQAAVIIDPANPPEVAPVLKEATDAGKIKLTAIVNTHHHWDHAGGNKGLLEELGSEKLEIIGGKDCEGVTKTPAHGETFKIGDITVKSVHTPCHTQDSICYFMEDSTGKAVFTGDTLFHGGCGRFFEGNAEEMHEALNKRLAALPDDTKVYSGHEYTKSNVKFGISILQSEAVKALDAFAENNKVTTGAFTIGDEKKHNVFMRVDDPEIQKATGETDPVSVMAKLREMKNSFNQNIHKYSKRSKSPKHVSERGVASAARDTTPLARTPEAELSTDELNRVSILLHCPHFLALNIALYKTALCALSTPSLHVTDGRIQRPQRTCHALVRPPAQMPPRRKSGGVTASSSTAAPKPRLSKLAKEHNVTAQEEGEIKEAYSLFAEPMDGEKNGVLPINDLKSALIALGIPPTPAELKEFISILDPDSDGYATYEPFFAICALKFHARADRNDDGAHRRELEDAFALFTRGGAGGGGGGGPADVITLAHLRRVAAVLKEDVDEELLKDMILEANGGQGVARGVGKDEFDGVMRSAGVWR